MLGVFEQVGYPTDHWVVECKGGPFLPLFPGFPVGFSLYMSALAFNVMYREVVAVGDV